VKFLRKENIGMKRVYTVATVLATLVAIVLVLVFVIFPGGIDNVKSPEESLNFEGAQAQKVMVPDVPRGPDEGITVHGHWAIDVQNPDGTLVEHLEFENDLQPDGCEVLALILAREETVEHWRLYIWGDPQPCLGPTGNPAQCFIIEPGGTAGSNAFDNLVVTVDGTGTEAKIMFEGYATIGNSTDINGVGTSILTLPMASYLVFTSRTITPVPVVPGQIVLISVEIFFS
jgi:hypothetical protein